MLHLCFLIISEFDANTELHEIISNMSDFRRVFFVSKNLTSFATSLSFGIAFCQVIKCLLIEPNPESALNEEAGKLLLENYNEFHQRAALMTEIHAKPRPNSPASQKLKAKVRKDKKKTLKRL